MEVPSPGSPTIPTVLFWACAQNSMNLSILWNICKVLGFLLRIKVDPNMEGLISACASKYNLRTISTIQRHSSNNEQLLLVVFAELDPLELHYHGQLGAVYRELWGNGDVVLLVRDVHQPDLLGGEGNFLAGCSDARIECTRNPSLVPSALGCEFIMETSIPGR